MKQMRDKKKLPPVKYGVGEKVLAPGFSSEPLEVESMFWNGFVHMYHFKGSDMGLGENYLQSLQPEKPTP